MSAPLRIPSFCTQCRSRCGCTALVEDGRLTGLEPAPDHPSGAKLCPKGRAAPELVHHPDRLTRPLRRTSPKGVTPARWEPISWEAALDEIAGQMARIRATHGAEQVAFSATTPSGTHLSDCIAWIERLIRAFGSPNTIYSTEICNWHKDYATRFTYGWDIGTPDFATAETILLWGHNPAATWLARSTEIQKALRRGAKLIVVDPRPTLYSRRATHWLRVRPGSDQILALGLVHLLLETGSFDRAFAAAWTNGPLLVRRDSGRFLRESDLRDGGSAAILFAAAPDGSLLRYDSAAGAWLDAPPKEDSLFAEIGVRTREGPAACSSALTLLRETAAACPAERVTRETGVAEADLRAVAALLGNGTPLAYYAWNGIGQSVTATQTDRALSILYGLTGCYGRAGGNVPGAAVACNDISGRELISEAQKAKALGLRERPLGPPAQGWVTARDVYRAVLERDPYPVRMLVSFGGNLLSNQPDTARAIAAFKALEFHVHSDFFLNATADYADIVLPAATSWEREGLRPGFDASLEGLRRVQLRPAAVAPQGEARSDTDIALGLAERLGLSAAMFGGDADAGHAHLLEPSGVSLEQLRTAPEGVVVDSAVALEPYRESGFPTPSKRLEIYSEALLEAGYPPLPSLEEDEEALTEDYPLRLGCAKTVAYCHSQGRNLPALRRLAPDPVLEMAPETAEAHGLAAGDWVEIRTPAGRFAARAALSKGLAAECVFAQHGWLEAAPQGGVSSNFNSAVASARADPVSGSLPLRSVACALGKL
ncbi:MAG: molybdopterin-dependent oxidoreductase [Rhodovibrionaceae bacterium]